MSLKDKMLDGYDDLRSKYIEELDETIYAKRFTLAKQAQVQHLYDNKTDRLKPEALAEIVVRFTLDEEGQRLFTREDIKELMRRAEMQHVSDIANWIVGGDEEDRSIQDHEKNLDGADID